MNKSEIILLPNSLDSEKIDVSLFPEVLASVIPELKGIFVEDEKNARKYLLQFIDRLKMQEISMACLNRNTTQSELNDYINLVKKGGKYGILSEAGMPCIADPGSKLVDLANKNSILVKVISGPSSVMMALMLSGFSAQRFVFQGYLPRKVEDLADFLQKIEKKAKIEQSTQIWIETPYRSDKMLQMCKDTLSNTTLLSVSVNLTASDQKVFSMPIDLWKQKEIEIGKKPCVFLIAHNI